MRIQQSRWDKTHGWDWGDWSQLSWNPELVLVFGATEAMKQERLLNDIQQRYPSALVCGCTTSGEILGNRIHDDSLVVTAVSFAATRLAGAVETGRPGGDSKDLGAALARQLPKKGLVHVLVLSDGLRVNGSELARGLQDELPVGVTVTGGLAGDGSRFQETLVVYDGQALSGAVLALGLYSDSLRVGHGSLGGWDAFGPERLITRSKGSVLYELDGKSALMLYKEYLGKHAEGLPATGLLFPLCLRRDLNDPSKVVRTILAVNEQEQSLTFAGDMPEGYYARLMKANLNRLVDGAEGAAKASLTGMAGARPELALLISCVGRKLVFKQRVEEELEAVREVLGPQAMLTGFYSYGELSPLAGGVQCGLHNQTMTITTLSETA